MTYVNSIISSTDGSLKSGEGGKMLMVLIKWKPNLTSYLGARSIEFLISQILDTKSYQDLVWLFACLTKKQKKKIWFDFFLSSDSLKKRKNGELLSLCCALALEEGGLSLIRDRIEQA